MKTLRKPRRTHHKKAFANPKTKELIATLHREWKSLSKLERGKTLNSLVDLGCTLRGLTEDLGQALTTLRRHVDLASTADKDQHSASTVLSQPVLATRTVRAKNSGMPQSGPLPRSKATIPVPIDGVNQSKQPVPVVLGRPSLKAVAPAVIEHSTDPIFHQARKPGTLRAKKSSDYVARVLVAFLLNLKTEGKICRGDIKFLFDRVNLEFERKSSRVRRFPAMASTAAVVARCKPGGSHIPGALWIDFYVMWVAQIAYCLAPEKKIRDVALKTAMEQAFERCPG